MGRVETGPDRTFGRARAGAWRRRAVAAGLAGAMAALLPAQGNAENLTLSYHFAWGHVTLAEAVVTYRQSGARYSLVGSGRTLGMLDLLSSWEGRAETEGVMKGGDRQPLMHEHEGTSRQNTRWTRVAWNGAAVPRTEARPPADPAKVTPVPEASTVGTSDPFTVLLSVFDRLAADGRCEADARVWDGRRRYDLSVLHLGAEQLVADRPWTYGGRAIECALEMKRIGGFWRDASSWRDPEDTAPVRRVIWVAEVAPDRWAMVRAELETRFGTVVGRLRYDGRAGDVPAVAAPEEGDPEEPTPDEAAPGEAAN